MEAGTLVGDGVFRVVGPIQSFEKWRSEASFSDMCVDVNTGTVYFEGMHEALLLEFISAVHAAQFPGISLAQCYQTPTEMYPKFVQPVKRVKFVRTVANIGLAVHFSYEGNQEVPRKTVTRVGNDSPPVAGKTYREVVIWFEGTSLLVRNVETVVLQDDKFEYRGSLPQTSGS
jgi:hypothetical protein